MTVVVVGSGHNALVAACYLARAGHAVEVLERDEVLGGAVSTVERFPGHQVDRGSSAHIMIRHTGIIEELELAHFGLRYIDCDPWGFTPAHDGRAAIVFHRDLESTCASITQACGAREAAAYRRFVRVWGPRSASVMRAFGGAPTPGRLVRSFWGLDATRGGSALSHEFLQSGDALLDASFEDERLKASLAWFGAQSGPPMSEPGTAPMVGFAALMHTLPPGRAVGGSGALTAALVARLRSDGGVVTAGDAVHALHRDGDRWQVRTASGRSLHADIVVAGAHVLTTLDLLREGDSTARCSTTGEGGFGSDRASEWWCASPPDRCRATRAARPTNPRMACNFSCPIEHSCVARTVPRWPGSYRRGRWCWR